MRRVLFSLVVVGVVFAIAYGAAASLNVDGGVVQAGGDSVKQCDKDGVSVDYQLKYDDNQKAFVVDGVIVSGIDEACLGKGFNLDVVLTDQAGQSIASGSVSNVGATTRQQVGVTKPGGGKPLAQDVYGVHVAIYRP
ncbi:MAG: hypothetical protein C4316_03045 [Chloroflexota bacterium]